MTYYLYSYNDEFDTLYEGCYVPKCFFLSCQMLLIRLIRQAKIDIFCFVSLQDLQSQMNALMYLPNTKNDLIFLSYL